MSPAPRGDHFAYARRATRSALGGYLEAGYIAAGEITVYPLSAEDARRMMTGLTGLVVERELPATHGLPPMRRYRGDLDGLTVRVAVEVTDDLGFDDIAVEPATPAVQPASDAEGTR